MSMNSHREIDYNLPAKQRRIREQRQQIKFQRSDNWRRRRRRSWMSPLSRGRSPTRTTGAWPTPTAQ